MDKEKTNGGILLTNICKVVAVVFLVGAAVLAVNTAQVKSQEKTKYSIEKLDTSVTTRIERMDTSMQSAQKEFQKENTQAHKDIRQYVKAKTSDRWQKKNDELYMNEIIRINGLKKVPHVRTVDP